MKRPPSKHHSRICSENMLTLQENSFQKMRFIRKVATASILGNKQVSLSGATDLSFVNRKIPLGPDMTTLSQSRPQSRLLRVDKLVKPGCVLIPFFAMSTRPTLPPFPSTHLVNLGDSGRHVTSLNLGLFLNDNGGKEERPWERGWREVGKNFPNLFCVLSRFR